MGTVLPFRQRERIQCSCCSKESRHKSGKPLWAARLPLDRHCSLYLVVYSSGWSRNETIQANRVNGEEKITFKKTVYLCPACSHHALD